MKNYTTQTAALKATTVDTRLLDAKRIDTEKLFINGELFNHSKIKESPNEATFTFIIQPTPNYEMKGDYVLHSTKLDQVGVNRQFEYRGLLLQGSKTVPALPNGVYAIIYVNDNFAKCIGGNSLDNADIAWLYNIPLAKFLIETTYGIEQCIFENFITGDADGQLIWVIKLCEEDDNLSELYGGVTDEYPNFGFLVSIPYYIPENDTSSSTYSLRKTNPFDSLREKFEQMRQQMLDKSAE